MLELTAQELANQLKIVAQITEKLLLHPLTDLNDVRDEINRLGAYLQACETKLIRLMNNEHPSDTEPGSTQYGLALYVLDTTHPVLRRLLNFPKTQITLAMLKQWDVEVSGAGAIDYDGSLIVKSKFGNLDASWVTALIYYLALKLDVREVSSWAQFAVVYSDQSFPAQNGVKARCVGHGAIPFGIAYGLQNGDGTNKPSVEYFAHELLSSVYENTDVQQANRVLCGFAMLTLGPDSISEQFIDQTGMVRWSQTTAL